MAARSSSRSARTWASSFLKASRSTAPAATARSARALPGATRSLRPLRHTAALPEAGREIDDAVGECRRELTLDHVRKLTFDALLHAGDAIIERVNRFLGPLTRHDHPNDGIQELAVDALDVARP